MDKKSSINIHDSQVHPAPEKLPTNVTLTDEKLLVESISDFMPDKWLDELLSRDGRIGRLSVH